MTLCIGGKELTFISNPIIDEKFRDSYFDLVEKVFGLDFTPWYDSGFYSGNFIPYTLFDNTTAVSSVGVVINDLIYSDSLKRFIQISTVVTDTDYRKMGHGRWLTEMVLNEWQDKCDCIYLYANDSVLDFYPKFGFQPAHEYRYHMAVHNNPLQKIPDAYRKLDLSNQNDVDILVGAYKKANPFSLFSMINGLDLMMFHCITFLHDFIYYVERYDAVVVAEEEENNLFCYDIFTDADCSINDVLGIIASNDIESITLGFTPKDKTGFSVEKADEKDTTVFVLKDMENIFASNQITLPFLSRA